MSNKNIEMKCLNVSGEYDTLYPKTLGSNIIVDDLIASEMGLDSGATVDEALSMLQSKVVTNVIYNATVTTSWIESEGYYYQDITVSGIQEQDTPIVDIKPSSDNSLTEQYSKAMCKVLHITTSANKIRVWATEAINTSFNIQLKVVR